MLKEHEIKTIKVYSPLQVFIGSLWGGPIAVVYFLRYNFLALGKEKYAQKTLNYGMLFIVLLLVAIIFLPDSFFKQGSPLHAVPLMYSVFGQLFSSRRQLRREDIKNSDVYQLESNWKIFGIGAITLLLFLFVAIIGTTLQENM